MGDRDPHISSSEIESLSDSEWLDLSSHASEVSDLLESDVEDPFSRPHSPHSTSSLSERNEGPDRWEGVLEAEDADESSSDDGDAEDDSDGLANPIGVNLQGTIRARDIVRHRLVEDVREREALEQSMVSTLSTSRSNSLTASASTTGSRTRDLRLSFPDPLTPPRDELNRSYDNVQADDVYSTPNPLLPLALGPEVGVTSISASAEGPVRAIATEILQPQPSAQPDFEIVLYGSQSSNKFILVESLLGKLATRSGLNLSKRLPLAPRLSTYLLDVKSKPFASVLSVQIIDNTEAEMTPVCGELPSLAIIFLPHFLPSLPRHDLYLPVVETQRGPSDISDSNEGFSTDLLRGGVERQWDMLRTPMMQTLLWHVDSPTTVLSLDEITALDATEVALGFEPLIPRRRRFVNALRAQIASAPAMTFIAILSIVLGYIVSMSSSMALPAPAEREVVAAAVKAFANTTQISSAILTPASVTIQQPIAIMSPLPISLSTVAPSTHDQLAPVLTPTAEPHAMPKVSQSLNPIAHSSQTRSLSLTLSSTKSLSVAPSTIKSVAVPHAATYELSSRLASTFQDLFSPVAIRADMKELLNALEELLRVLAFNTQTTLNMLNVADNLRDNLRRRHRRAQERARRLRDKGAEAFIGASKRVSERMDIARRRAKALQTQFGDETRAMVKRAQRRWAEGQRVST